MGKLMIMPMQTETQLKICTAIARKIISMHGDQHQIYVVVEKDWEERLAQMCPEIKLATFHHPDEELQREWLARTGKNKNEVIANLCEDYIRVWNNPQRKTDMVDTMVPFNFGICLNSISLMRLLQLCYDFLFLVPLKTLYVGRILREFSQSHRQSLPVCDRNRAEHSA